MKRLLVSACALVLAAALSASPARAQGVTTAAVAGRVMDEAGGPVGQAELTLVNGSTGVRYSARSRDDGRYSFEVVEVGGPYTLSVRALGYEPKTLDQFSLTLSQRLTLDVSLKKSAVEVAGITVEANSDPRLSAARTGASTFLSDTAIHRLPTLNRSFTDFVNTSPQVAPGPNGRSINGQNDRFNNIQIDGSVNNDLFALGSSTGVPGGAVNERPISLEAVQEYQIQIAPFDVRQGGFVGGLVNAVTKSGTNEFHGSLFGYMQNQSFVGSDTAGVSVPVATYQQQQYGFSVGGPIIKDKLHFFATGDFRHDVRPFASSLQIGNSGVPSDTAGIGITSAQADSVAGYLQNLYHFANPGSWQAPTIPNPETNLFGKLDYELGENSHLEVSGTYVNANQITLIHKFTSPFNGRDGYELSNSGYNTQNQTRTVRGKWTATFANKYSNEAILAYTTISDNRNPESSMPLVLVHVNPTNFNDYVSAGAERFSQNNILDQKSFEVTDNLTFTAGEHLLTVGTHNEFFSFKNVFFPASFGVWNFGNIDSLSKGLPDRFEQAKSTLGPLGPVADFSVKQFGLYAEDRFSPIRNLTLTAGLRMDVPSIPAPIENTAIDTIHLSSLGGGVIHTSNSPTGNMLWSPRLGFNYDLNGSQQTIFRGGVGIFSGRPPYVWVSNAFGNTGVGSSTLLCTTPGTVPVLTPDGSGGFTFPTNPSTCNGGAGPTSSATSIVFYDPSFKFPQALKVALGLDHQLGWGILGTADFIYTRSINQFYLTDVNLPDVQTTAAGEGGRPLYVQPTAFNAATGAVSAHRLTAALGQAIENVNKSADRATQLTFQLQKRFENGLEFNAAYTYSHVLDLFSYTSDISGSNFNFGALDGTIANRNLRTSVYDRPNKITISGTVNIPFDIRFSLIYAGISGTPFTYVVANDVNGDGVGGNDPVYVPKDQTDIEMKNGLADYNKLNAYINGEPCLRDARGSLLERDTCRNPWQNSLNARLSKVVPTIHGQSVEITIDMLNVLNFVNSSWGLIRQTSGFEEANLLRLSGYDPVAQRGIYTLSLPVKNAVALNSLGSRWVFQLGARYAF
ncbi:MAG TPA: carboxypeptidase regulatory-like domain-containing protein [Gemmatimonadales bacterium]|nr:carboxypeptidase regulatory-like domain-containing protein [Gemmatimonadales bacterium]